MLFLWLFLFCSISQLFFFFFNDTATTEIYTVMNTLSLHDALPISNTSAIAASGRAVDLSRSGSTPWRERSEEHTSELQSLITISYAVFCLKKKKYTQTIKYKVRLMRKNI